METTDIMDKDLEAQKMKAKTKTLDCIDWICIICMLIANAFAIYACESPNERSAWICCLIWVTRVIFDKFKCKT